MGVELGHAINKGDYSGTWVTVDMQSVRVEQLATKTVESQPFPVAPNDWSNTAYPVTIMADFLQIDKTFRINGILSDSGNRYAIDRKNIITDMCDSGGTGSLTLNLVPNASGTLTGSESWMVNFINYNFIQETPNVNKYSYQMMLRVGSQIV